MSSILSSSNSTVKYVATIGSFDGVHCGHQFLLKQVRRIADERALKAMAITFRVSPKSVLGMVGVPSLTSITERIDLLHKNGMDEVVALDFTRQEASMSARDFMQQVLKEQLGVEVLVIGYDHRFGRGRSEGFDDYVRYGLEMGVEVVRGEARIDEGGPISSTRIRCLLEEGKVEDANLLLGYRYTLQGNVVDGYKEGRKLGFPTANIRSIDDCKLVPSDGVYAVWVLINNVRHMGMLNIGYRPTLNNGKERSIEVHILDFVGDIYGKEIQVEFVHCLREERTFACLEELASQLRRDEKIVRELLA